MGFSSNEAAVLKAIFSLDTPTRLAISRDSSLSPVVVSAVLDSLLEKSAIRKERKITQTMGRPPLVYEMDGNLGYAVGITVDIESARLVVVNTRKELIAEELVPFDVADQEAPRGRSAAVPIGAGGPSGVQAASGEEASVFSQKAASPVRSPALVADPLDPPADSSTPRLLGLLVEMCAGFIRKKGLPAAGLVAIGLGLPGAVNPRTGVWIQGLRVSGIDKMHVRETFESRFGVVVSVEDVARTIAYYERTLGLGRGIDDFVVLHIGAGVGAGASFGGRLYGGHHGLAGEIGHLTVDPHGYRCICGNIGCLETVASLEGILRRFKDRIREVGAQALRGRYFADFKRLSIADILCAARNDDKFTRSILFEIGTYLGEACTKLISLYDPQRIIVSGGASLCGDFFLESMKQVIAKRFAPALYTDFDLVFADYAPHHETYGAALIAMDTYWSNAAP